MFRIIVRRKSRINRNSGCCATSSSVCSSSSRASSSISSRSSNSFGTLLAVLSLEEPLGVMLLLVDLDAEPKEHSQVDLLQVVKHSGIIGNAPCRLQLALSADCQPGSLSWPRTLFHSPLPAVTRLSSARSADADHTHYTLCTLAHAGRHSR